VDISDFNQVVLVVVVVVVMVVTAGLVESNGSLPPGMT